MNPKRHQKRPYWTFGEGAFVMVCEELKKSVAYKVLTSTQRLILLDMIRVYAKASGSGKHRIDGGFPYTFSICTENVCETSFQKGVREILKRGFFDAPATLQDDRPASAKRYVQSRKWEDYKPAKEELQKLNRYDLRKSKRIIEKRKRVTNFRVGHKTK